MQRFSKLHGQSLSPAAAQPLGGTLPRYRTIHGGSGRTADSKGERVTRKGPWRAVLHSPFFRGRMFWEERVCWQPDPPSGCGDLQRRLCWQLTFPLLLLCFCFWLVCLFCHSHYGSLPQKTSWSAPSFSRSTSSAILKSLLSLFQVPPYHAPHQEAPPTLFMWESGFTVQWY